MKGQLSYEFYMAILVFITFTAYIFFQVFAITPAYTEEVASQLLHSEAYQLSEILINDEGEPPDWETRGLDEVKRIGLSSTQGKLNLLSDQKISKLNEICSTNYQAVMSRLDVSGYQFALNLTNIEDNSVLISCSPPQVIARTRLKVRVTRIATTVSGVNVRLVLEVW